MNSTAIVASLETLHKWNQTPNNNISSTPTIIVSQINQHGKPIELSSTTELIIIPNICHYFPIHPTNIPDALISITFLISNSLDKIKICLLTVPSARDLTTKFIHNIHSSNLQYQISSDIICRYLSVICLQLLSL